MSIRNMWGIMKSLPIRENAVLNSSAWITVGAFRKIVMSLNTDSAESIWLGLVNSIEAELMWIEIRNGVGHEENQTA